MPRYLAACPDELDCGVCRLVHPIAKFNRQRSTKRPISQAWSISDICDLCRRAYRQYRLTPAQHRRYDEISRANRDNSTAAKARHLANVRAAGQRAKPLPKGMAPYDLAVAQLEAEWGKPCATWTLADDYKCTERIYTILGWPVEELARNSATARQTQVDRVREARLAQTRAAKAAHNDD